MRETTTIGKWLGLLPVKGDVGIEIEMEGGGLFPPPPVGWRAEPDGSLRGYSIEYVLASPIPLKEVSDYLKSLKGAIDKSKCKPKYSHRAGVHIHVNCQNLTPEQLIRFVLLYYCFERVLINGCGPDRVGNHFCLRLEDAEAPLKIIEQLSTFKQLMKFNTDFFRYAALNLTSLFKYGSVEFRALESQPDFSKIKEYCEILVRIRDYAVNLDSRRSIAERMSYLGPEVFMVEVIGQDNYQMLQYKEAEMDILDSMRVAQMAIYSGEL